MKYKMQLENKNLPIMTNLWMFFPILPFNTAPLLGQKINFLVCVTFCNIFVGAGVGFF